MRVQSTVIVLLYLLAVCAYGQGYDLDSLLARLDHDITTDDRARTLHEITGVYNRYDGDSTLLYARMAYNLTKNGQIDSLHGQSITNLSSAFFNVSEIDSAKNLLLRSLDFHRNRNDNYMVAVTYRNLSTVGEYLNEPDTILNYLDKCFAVLSEHPDSVLYGDALYSKAFAYQTKGYYEIAVQSILEATRIFEELNLSLIHI